MVEQLVAVPKMRYQDGMQRRTSEQIVDLRVFFVNYETYERVQCDKQCDADARHDTDY